VKVFLNDDLDAVKAFALLAKTNTSCYIRTLDGAFTQANTDNALVAIPDGSALNVTKYYADTVPPTLLAYTVTASGILTMKFSEPVNSATFDILKFTFRNSLTASTYTYDLTITSTFRSESDLKRTIVYIISTDFRLMDELSTLFNAEATTWLSVTGGAVSDLSGNSIISIAPTGALQPGPAVYQWELDMNTGAVTIRFTDPVSATFGLFGLTVQNAISGSTYSTTLTTGGVVNQTDSTGVSFTGILTNKDLSLIKFMGMGSTTTDTFLVVPYGITTALASDTFVANLKSIEKRSSLALMLRSIVVDITSPLCLYFDLNVGLGQVVLTFDEPMLASSLVVSDLTLLSEVRVALR
jgi:hypothetical protein